MNRTLLVTGASGGIAQAIIRSALPDWRVVAVSRKSEPATFMGQRWVQVESYDTSVLAVVMDETQPDALIHTVGSTLVGPMAGIGLSQFEALIHTNLFTAYAALQAFVAHLKSRRTPGSAVLFSSVVAQIGVAHHEAISAAKAAVEGLVRSSAASVSGAGIRINAIAPGLTETPLAQPLLASEAGRAAALKQYPLPGINQPKHIADAALWLSSDAAVRITGQTLAVDGGFTAIRPLVR